MSTEQIKTKALPILKTNNVEFAGIFGSHARGQANKKSDLDLLVRFTKPQGLLKIVRLERILSEALNKKVDLVTEGALSPYIKQDVLNDLKIIYEKR